VIAYEPSFIEIRHVETGFLQQVLYFTGLKVLSVDSTLNTHLVAESSDSSDFQHVFKLKQLLEGNQ
jgi:hypothetical protein